MGRQRERGLRRAEHVPAAVEVADRPVRLATASVCFSALSGGEGAAYGGGQPAAAAVVVGGWIGGGGGVGEAVRGPGFAVQRFSRGSVPGTVLAACRPRRVVVVIGQSQELTRVRLAQAGEALLAELSGQNLHVEGWRVGVGGPVAGLRELASAGRQAAVAVAALGAEPQRGPVANWSETGAYALLGQFAAESWNGMMIPPGVRTLLESPSHALLVQTVETYLDCGGEAQHTAVEVRIHRTTLYYRPGRASGVCGLDLRDGRDRLLLHLVLKLRRLSALPTYVEERARPLLHGAG